MSKHPARWIASERFGSIAKTTSVVVPAAALMLYLGAVVFAWHPGRMTGGGSVFRGTSSFPVMSADLDTSGRVTHGFEIHCGSDADPSSNQNNLEINWKDNNGDAHKFKLDKTLTSAHCDYIQILGAPDPPDAGFNWFEGFGTGKYDNKPGATIHFVFTDVGEPGGTNGTPPPDTAFYDIKDSGGNQVLKVGELTMISQTDPDGTFTFNVGGIPLTFGNHQAHDN